MIKRNPMVPELRFSRGEHRYTKEKKNEIGPCTTLGPCTRVPGMGFGRFSPPFLSGAANEGFNESRFYLPFCNLRLVVSMSYMYAAFVRFSLGRVVVV